MGAGAASKDVRRASALTTPVHSSRGSGSYSPSQVPDSVVTRCCKLDLGARPQLRLAQVVGEEAPILYWRPTEPRDLPRILELANSDVMSIYGEADDIPAML